MQLRLDGLDSHLRASAQRGLAPIYTLHGDEPLLQIEAVDAIRRCAREQGFSERDVIVNERSSAWPQLAAASQSLSLFGDRKIIELKIPTGKPGKDGADALKRFAAQQTQAAAADALDSVTIITLPRLDAATQKSAWFAALDAAGVTLRIDPVDRIALPAWIAQRLAQQRQQVEAGEPGQRALHFIADRVEGNLLAAHQEIRKLGLLYPEGVVTAEQIQEAVLNVARYDVFKLSEAMLAGDVPRLIRMLDGLRGEGEASVLVLWALTEEIRTLVRLSAGVAAGKALGQLLREYRIWGAREKWMPAALKRLAPALLQHALQRCALLDRQNKGLKVPELSGDVWDGMLALALIIARGAPATTSRR